MLRALLVGSVGAAVVAAGLIVAAQPEASARTAGPAGGDPQLSQLLGFVDGKLVRIAPETLEPLPGRGIAVGSGGCVSSQGGTACWTNPPWSTSPDGMRLAVARNNASSLRIVDVKRMRVTTDVRLAGGAVGALAWLAPRRVLAIQEASGERKRLLAIDLDNRRMVARRALGGSVRELGRTAQELVMLLAPAGTIGQARIAVADRRGAIRFVSLPGILAGSKLLGTGSNHRVDTRSPGLAVDAQSRRAFVVDKDQVAEVDLRTLSVSYHALERPASLLTRLWNWLEPAAAAKQVSGYARSARWLGGDLLGVSGTDTEPFVDAGKQGIRMTPTGLLIVDTNSWSVRLVDGGATTFHVAGNLLLATGWSWDSVTGQERSIGLAAYGVDGAKRFHLFEGKGAWLSQVYGGRAYVGLISAQAEPLRIVDLASGSVVGLRQQPLPWLLLGSGAGWWG